MAKQQARLGPFDLRFNGVRLPMGLTVRTVRVQGEGAKIDAHPFSLVLDEPASMVAEVLEDDLAAFLEAQAPGELHGFTVRVGDGRLYVMAKKTLLVELKISAVANLRIVDGRQLWVDVESVEVMGAGVKNLVQSALAKVNPVIDAKDFPVDATLSSVEMTDGKVVLHGTVAPP